MRAERSGGRHRSPFRLRRDGKLVFGGQLVGLSERRCLPARFARESFLIACGGRACGSARCTTAPLFFAGKSLSGRFELAHFARLGNVTAFLRYAERRVSALSVTPRYKYALSSSDIAVCIGSASRSSCRFSSNLDYEPRRGQPVGALAASFWRRERKAEPTTRRSVLLSMRQGPAWFSRKTDRATARSVV